MEILQATLKHLDTFNTNRILFIEAFHLKEWNGYTARHIKGTSGTHSASMYLAEEFAKRGYEVDFVSPNIIDTTYLGVNYKNFQEFPLNTVYDYIFTTNNMLDLQIANKVVHYKKLIVIMGNPLLQPDFLNVFKIPVNKFVVAYVSKTSQDAICLQQPSLTKFTSIILHNSINLDDIQPIVEKDNSFVFFACADRGYGIAAEVANAFPHFKLYSNTYANELKYLLKEQTDDSSKNAVFKRLAQSKYFVYPLINLEKGSIHYDTFAYVILEALLHGVVVITVRNPVFEELFGDAVCYIDTDDIFSRECFKTWSNKIEISVEVSEFLKEYTRRFIEKVKILEGFDNLRGEYIRKGLALRDKFSNTTVLNSLFEYLKSPQTYLVQKRLLDLANIDALPNDHFNYLVKLKQSGFEPKVIYDIGACVLHWTRKAKELWPNATYILFDAFKPAEFLYQNYQYSIGVLSDTDGKTVKFYQNDYMPGGNSYYREIGYKNGELFPESASIEMKTAMLDTIVKERGFPLPDFIKIDVQGAEIDVLRGALNTIKNAKRMVVELQHTEWNLGAHKNTESLEIIKEMGWDCCDPLFSNNGPDGDYSFVRRDF